MDNAVSGGRSAATIGCRKSFDWRQAVEVRTRARVSDELNPGSDARMIAADAGQRLNRSSAMASHTGCPDQEKVYAMSKPARNRCRAGVAALTSGQRLLAEVHGRTAAATIACEFPVAQVA
jgi:hypothetical protein